MTTKKRINRYMPKLKYEDNNANGVPYAAQLNKKDGRRDKENI